MPFIATVTADVGVHLWQIRTDCVAKCIQFCGSDQYFID